MVCCDRKDVEVDMIRGERCSIQVGTSGCLLFFFFKQKSAYDVRVSLVGSEMSVCDR